MEHFNIISLIYFKRNLHMQESLQYILAHNLSQTFPSQFNLSYNIIKFSDSAYHKDKKIFCILVSQIIAGARKIDLLKAMII